MRELFKDRQSIPQQEDRHDDWSGGGAGPSLADNPPCGGVGAGNHGICCIGAGAAGGTGEGFGFGSGEGPGAGHGYGWAACWSSEQNGKYSGGGLGAG